MASTANFCYIPSTGSSSKLSCSIPATKQCGDPTTPSFSGSRLRPITIPIPITGRPASPWTGSAQPCSPCPRKAASCPSCAASAPSHPSTPDLRGTHLVPIRTSVWMRGAPDWWTSVWARPMTPMTSCHGPSASVSTSAPEAHAESGRRRLTDRRAGRVQGKVQPARAHQLLDLRDLGRHRGRPRAELRRQPRSSTTQTPDQTRPQPRRGRELTGSRQKSATQTSGTFSVE